MRHSHMHHSSHSSHRSSHSVSRSSSSSSSRSSSSSLSRSSSSLGSSLGRSSSSSLSRSSSSLGSSLGRSSSSSLSRSSSSSTSSNRSGLFGGSSTNRGGFFGSSGSTSLSSGPRPASSGPRPISNGPGPASNSTRPSSFGPSPIHSSGSTAPSGSSFFGTGHSSSSTSGTRPSSFGPTPMQTSRPLSTPQPVLPHTPSAAHSHPVPPVGPHNTHAPSPAHSHPVPPVGPHNTHAPSPVHSHPVPPVGPHNTHATSQVHSHAPSPVMPHTPQPVAQHTPAPGHSNNSFWGHNDHHHDHHHSLFGRPALPPPLRHLPPPPPPRYYGVRHYTYHHHHINPPRHRVWNSLMYTYVLNNAYNSGFNSGYNTGMYANGMTYDQISQYELQRRNSICSFDNNFSIDDFIYIAQNRAAYHRNITITAIEPPFIIGRFKEGFTTYDFEIDFNNYGHVNGEYWIETQANSINELITFADEIKSDITYMMGNRGINLAEFNNTAFNTGLYSNVAYNTGMNTNGYNTNSYSNGVNGAYGNGVNGTYSNGAYGNTNAGMYNNTTTGSGDMTAFYAGVALAASQQAMMNQQNFANQQNPANQQPMMSQQNLPYVNSEVTEMPVAYAGNSPEPANTSEQVTVTETQPAPIELDFSGTGPTIVGNNNTVSVEANSEDNSEDYSEDNSEADSLVDSFTVTNSDTGVVTTDSDSDSVNVPDTSSVAGTDTVHPYIELDFSGTGPTIVGNNNDYSDMPAEDSGDNVIEFDDENNISTISTNSTDETAELPNGYASAPDINSEITVDDENEEETINIVTVEDSRFLDIPADGHELQAGERVDISDYTGNRLDIVMTYDYAYDDMDIDGYAFMIDKNNKVTADEDLIFFGNETSQDNSVSAELEDGYSAINITLSEADAIYDKIDICFSAYGEDTNLNFGKLSGAMIRIICEGKELYHFSLEKIVEERCVTAVQFYRNNDSWKLKVVCAGYKDKLEKLCENYGVVIED